MTNNLFKLPDNLPEMEVHEAIIPDAGVLVERIISTGQFSPDGFWYEQDRDEWVVLLQGKAAISWEEGKLTPLKNGDWLLIPAGKKHRVEYTSQDPPCIWLAIHGQLL